MDFCFKFMSSGAGRWPPAQVTAYPEPILLSVANRCEPEIPLGETWCGYLAFALHLLERRFWPTMSAPCGMPPTGPLGRSGPEPRERSRCTPNLRPSLVPHG